MTDPIVPTYATGTFSKNAGFLNDSAKLPTGSTQSFAQVNSQGVGTFNALQNNKVLSKNQTNS